MRARLVAIAVASVHGAYNPTMTTNPHLVSKAIFEWWWTHRGNRLGPPLPERRLPHRIHRTERSQIP